MAKFRSVRERSKLSMAGRSSLHPVQASTTQLEASLEATVLPAGRLDLTAPVTGRLEVDVESLKSGNDLYDLEMRRRLDTRRFPTIVAQVVEWRELDGNGRCRVIGDLSFHGVTRRVEGDVTIRLLGNRTLDVSGELTFDVRDFGVNPPTILMVKVFPDIRVSLQVVGERVD